MERVERVKRGMGELRWAIRDGRVDRDELKGG